MLAVTRLCILFPGKVTVGTEAHIMSAVVLWPLNCVCMYVCMCVCVCMVIYACCCAVAVDLCTCVRTYVCMYVCLCMYADYCVRVYVCMYVCMYGCMPAVVLWSLNYVCIYVSIYLCMYILCMPVHVCRLLCRGR